MLKHAAKTCTGNKTAVFSARWSLFTDVFYRCLTVIPYMVIYTFSILHRSENSELVTNSNNMADSYDNNNLPGCYIGWSESDETQRSIST